VVVDDEEYNRRVGEPGKEIEMAARANDMDAVREKLPKFLLAYRELGSKIEKL